MQFDYKSSEEDGKERIIVVVIDLLGFDSAIVEVIGEFEGLVLAGLRKANIGANEFPDFGSELEEDVSPASSVLRSKDFGFLFVHLQIHSEDRFARENPGPAPIPPLTDGASSEISNRGHGFGLADRPGGCRGGDRLDSEGERGETTAECLVGTGVGVRDREGVGERPSREEAASLLEGVDDGGHGDVRAEETAAMVEGNQGEMEKESVKGVKMMKRWRVNSWIPRLFYSLRGAGWVVG